jgi:mRNA interferase RelE/StbE
MRSVLIERNAEKDLDRLSREMYNRVITVIQGLAANPWPAGCRKLVGGQSDWRIRVGDYRIIYEIADQARLIRITRVRHRKEVYR